MKSEPSAVHRRRVLLLGSLGLLGAGAAHADWWGGGTGPTGSGTRTEQTRSLSGFDQIRLSGSFKVRVRPTGRESVLVRTDDNLQELVEIRVSADRVLEIGWKRGPSPRPSATPEVLVEVATLKSLAIAGSGDLFLEALQTAALAASVAGSGDLVIEGLRAESLTLAVAGSGDIKAGGRAAKLAVSISGSGDVDTDALDADEVSVRIAGSGDARVQARRTLDVSIAGSGDVRWRGDANLKSSVAGSGTISKRS